MNAEYALRYADILKWPVFTLAPGSKKPFKGSGGSNDATLDPTRIEAMFDAEPRSNVAIVPWRAGVTVADWDFDRGGNDLLQYVIKRHGTKGLATAVSPTRDGIHQYFVDTPWLVERREMAALKRPLYECGLEIFSALPYGKKGYVVAPYSELWEPQHSYEWQRNASPLVRELLPFPDLCDTFKAYLQQRGISVPSVEQDTQQSPSHLADPRGDLGIDKTTPSGRPALVSYDKSPEVLARLCELIGVPFDYKGQPRTSFLSPLRPEAHPSGSFFKMYDGSFRYRDWADGSNNYLPLAKVYALHLGRGRMHPMTNVEIATWQVRMLIDLGIWPKPQIGAMPLPPGATPAATLAYRGLITLLQCKFAYHGHLVSVPYSYHFCADWTQIPEGQARYGIKWLKESGTIRQVGTIRSGGRPTALWLPANLA